MDLVCCNLLMESLSVNLTLYPVAIRFFANHISAQTMSLKHWHIPNILKSDVSVLQQYCECFVSMCFKHLSENIMLLFIFVASSAGVVDISPGHHFLVKAWHIFKMMQGFWKENWWMVIMATMSAFLVSEIWVRCLGIYRIKFTGKSYQSRFWHQIKYLAQNCILAWYFNSGAIVFTAWLKLIGWLLGRLNCL